MYDDTLKYDFGILCEPESKEDLKRAIVNALATDLSIKKQNARKYAEIFLNKEMILRKFINKIK